MFLNFFMFGFIKKSTFVQVFQLKMVSGSQGPGVPGPSLEPCFFNRIIKKTLGFIRFLVFCVFIVFAYIFISFLLCHFRRNTIKPMVFLTFWWFSGCLFDIIFPSFFQCFLVTDTCSPLKNWILYRYYKLFALAKVLLFNNVFLKIFHNFEK